MFEGQFFPKQPIQFYGPGKKISPALSLTQKGYGYKDSPGDGASFTLTYGSVLSGSAPTSGDLVVWIAYSADGTAPATYANDLTGSGWAQGRSTTGTGSLVLAGTVLAKVLTSGDISSPPTAFTTPPLGSAGMWVAYTVTGTVTTLAVNNYDHQDSGTSAPSNDTQDSTSLGANQFAITISAGYGTDGTIGLSWSGATPDVQFQRTNCIDSGADEIEYAAHLSNGGVSVTISKPDDGGLNGLQSAYVSVI